MQLDLSHSQDHYHHPTLSPFVCVKSQHLVAERSESQMLCVLARYVCRCNGEDSASSGDAGSCVSRGASGSVGGACGRVRVGGITGMSGTGGDGVLMSVSVLGCCPIVMVVVVMVLVLLQA